MLRGLCLFSILTIIIPSTRSVIHFDKKTIHRHVCFYGDENNSRKIDRTLAKDGAEPVNYFLSGSPPFLSINASSGDIYLNETVVNISYSDITLMKFGRDSSGNTARLEIFLTLVQAKIFNETCPKSLHFEVRQIAPVGEEIGIVKCDQRTQFNDSRVKTSYRTVLVSQGKDIPFDLTDNGVIVVSDILVFHDNIKDITIFNVLLINDVINDVTNYCTRVNTGVTTAITVKQAECQVGWTYNLTKNLYLEVPSLATFHASSLSECMSNCSVRQSPQCNSIVYNVLTDVCYIHNATAEMNLYKTRQKIGYFYYRKICKTGMSNMITVSEFALSMYKDNEEMQSEIKNLYDANIPKTIKNVQCITLLIDAYPLVLNKECKESTT